MIESAYVAAFPEHAVYHEYVEHARAYSTRADYAPAFVGVVEDTDSTANLERDASHYHVEHARAHDI
eukprot:8547188-Lingulodinium_polyedra.AAC.1